MKQLTDTVEQIASDVGKRILEIAARRSMPEPGDLLTDDDLVLQGLAELHLMAGYIWLEESREIGPAVLSYRIGKKIGWIRLLEELRGDEFGFDFGGGTFPIAPPSGLPSLPTIAITITIDEEDSSASDGGL